jgi:L-amino acid N-acyltransferase YncA
MISSLEGSDLGSVFDSVLCEFGAHARCSCASIALHERLGFVLKARMSGVGFKVCKWQDLTDDTTDSPLKFDTVCDCVLLQLSL